MDFVNVLLYKMLSHAYSAFALDVYLYIAFSNKMMRDNWSQIPLVSTSISGLCPIVTKYNLVKF